jgi:hypothetical protein
MKILFKKQLFDLETNGEVRKRGVSTPINKYSA